MISISQAFFPPWHSHKAMSFLSDQSSICCGTLENLFYTIYRHYNKITKHFPSLSTHMISKDIFLFPVSAVCHFSRAPDMTDGRRIWTFPNMLFYAVEGYFVVELQTVIKIMMNNFVFDPERRIHSFNKNKKLQHFCFVHITIPLDNLNSIIACFPKTKPLHNAEASSYRSISRATGQWSLPIMSQ